MKQRSLALVLALTCLVLLVMGVGLGYAQAPSGAGVGSQMTALSIAQGGGIRVLAMGGTTTAVADESNIRNAASLPLIQRREPADYTVLTVAQTDLDGGHSFVVRGYSLGQVIPGKGGFLVRRTTLTSDAVTKPSGPAPESVRQLTVTDNVSYTAMLVAGGIQVSPKWSVGLTGALSDVQADATANTPFGPLPAQQIRGRGLGGVEAGVIHTVNERLRIGAVYSHWKERERVQAFLPAPSTTVTDYVTTIWKGGVAYQPDARTTVGFDWASLRYKNETTGATFTDSRPYYGAERVIGAWAVRAGSHGNAPAAGLGWTRGGWRVDYALVKDLNKKSAESMFGGTFPGSDSHYLSATVRF